MKRHADTITRGWIRTGRSQLLVALTLLISMSIACNALGTTGNEVTVNNNNGFPVGEPISGNDGKYYFTLPLMNLGGPLALRYAIRYSLGENASSGLLCHFQSSTQIFAEWMPHDDTGVPLVIVHLRNGKEIHFQYNDTTGEWDLDNASSNRYILKESGPDYITGFYYFMDPIQERVYIFQKMSTAGSPSWRALRLLYIMDRNGNTHTYTYADDDHYFPASIADGLGRQLNFTYADWNLTTITDHTGRNVTITYDDNAADLNDNKAVRSITDPLGGTTTFAYQYISTQPWMAPITTLTKPRTNTPYTQTYAEVTLNNNSAVRVTMQTDAYDNTMRIDYDSIMNKVTETQANSNSIEYQHYGNAGTPKNLEDASGNSASFGRSTYEQISSMTDREGDTTSFSYHTESGKLATYQDAEGNTTRNTYTAQTQTFTNPLDSGETIDFRFYNLTQIDYPDATNEKFSYDPNGNMLTRTNQSANVWTFTYNSQGLVLTVENPAGGTITNTYNADGTLATSIDPETGTLDYTYDTAKRLAVKTYPDNSTVEYTYNNNDLCTSMSNERGKTTTYTYDANGNLTTTANPDGTTIVKAYDNMDRILTVTDSNDKVTTYAYDTMNRLESVTGPNGVKVSYAYGSNGELTGYTFGDQTWQTAYDNEDIPTSKTTPLGYVTSYTSDRLGAITEITDPLSNKTKITRDAMQMVTAIKNPLGQTTTYTYNKEHLLTGITKSGIGTATYRMNSLGALSQIIDSKGNVWKFSYSDLGRLMAETDPLENTWAYTYNSRGRQAEVTYPDQTTLTIAYDATGNLTAKTYSSGLELAYRYDDLNRLIKAENITIPAENIGFTYDNAGKITATMNQDTVAESATYDDGGRLSTVTYQRNEEKTFTVTYTYDAISGLLSRVSDNLAAAQVDCTYDDDRRLTDITRKNSVDTLIAWNNDSQITQIQHGSFADIEYTVDGVGQVTKTESTVPLDPGSLLTADAQTYVFDDACQVSTSGFSYDELGQRTAGNGTTYTWDGAGRLTGSGNTILAYNGLSDLVRRTAAGISTLFHYNYAIKTHPIVSEQLSAGDYQKHYIYTPDGQLLYMIDDANSDAVYYYHFDNIGSTLFLTDSDGAITDTYAYSPYGILLGHNGTSTQPFTYVGKYGIRQEGTGGALYQMRARYYDAKTAQFLSRDPIWPDLIDIQHLNPYQYVSQNPLIYVDIQGTTNDDPNDPERDGAQVELDNVAAVVDAGIRGTSYGGATIGNTGKNIDQLQRYFWMPNVGWIDLQHAVSSATGPANRLYLTHYTAGLAMECLQGLQGAAAWLTFGWLGSEAAGASAFKAEDLRSNEYGMRALALFNNSSWKEGAIAAGKDPTLGQAMQDLLWNDLCENAPSLAAKIRAQRRQAYLKEMQERKMKAKLKRLMTYINENGWPFHWLPF